MVKAEAAIITQDGREMLRPDDLKRIRCKITHLIMRDVKDRARVIEEHRREDSYREDGRAPAPAAQHFRF